MNKEFDKLEHLIKVENQFWSNVKQIHKCIHEGQYYLNQGDLKYFENDVNRLERFFINEIDKDHFKVILDVIDELKNYLYSNNGITDFLKQRIISEILPLHNKVTEYHNYYLCEMENIKRNILTENANDLERYQNVISDYGHDVYLNDLIAFCNKYIINDNESNNEIVPNPTIIEVKTHFLFLAELGIIEHLKTKYPIISKIDNDYHLAAIIAQIMGCSDKKDIENIRTYIRDLRNKTDDFKNNTALNKVNVLMTFHQLK